MTGARAPPDRTVDVLSRYLSEGRYFDADHDFVKCELLRAHSLAHALIVLGAANTGLCSVDTVLKRDAYSGQIVQLRYNNEDRHVLRLGAVDVRRKAQLARALVRALVRVRAHVLCARARLSVQTLAFYDSFLRLSRALRAQSQAIAFV